MDNLTKKGLFFGSIGIIFVGFQPIVAISKPSMLDGYNNIIAAAMTCLVETALFFPLMLIELNKNKKSIQTNEVNTQSILQGWKNNFLLLIVIGFIFGINQIFFFIGYYMAGAINGSLTQKTTVFFSMLLGYLILKERITKLQIFFSFILFLGLTISITQFFSLIEFNSTILIGVLILLAISFLWMIGHSLTKPIFNRKEATPIQMVFIRNFLSGFILLFTYVLFFPLDYRIWLDPDNIFFYLIMGTVYGSGLVCWYKALSYLDISKASTILAPTPICTAVFASLILGANFTFFHLIGILLVVISIIFIVNQKRE
ncbi:MAG: DMT family transporter [Candidatus Thorarchaeota archaeon]